MLQIIAFGIGFVLIGMGVIAHDLKVLATPPEKRTASTGAAGRLIFVLLGLLIVVLAGIQGVSLVNF